MWNNYSLCLLESRLGMKWSVYKKELLEHPQFYVVKFSKKDYKESLVFIHGGPGFNCGVLEYFIEHDHLFETLNYNLILYDQRGCGKSTPQQFVSHQNNVEDLNTLLLFLAQHNIIVKGLIGHSYGAKLLYDFYCSFQAPIAAVFVGIADTMLTPRLNNLLSDLVYVKKTDPKKYQEIFLKMDKNLTLDSLWKLTEELAPLFQANQDRPFYAWANLHFMARAQEIQKLINVPINQDILMRVRQDIYSNKERCDVNLTNLTVPYLWINGFQDYAMNGMHNFYDSKNVRLFYQCGHYPHIEENKRFCETLNDFLR